MPANVSIDFVEAEKEYESADTIDNKIKSLKKMISLIPKHKGTEKMLAGFKTKLSKFIKMKEKEKQLKRKGKSSSIRKQGSATVCLFSLPNSGKSYLMNSITGSKLASTLRPFETTTPEVGMIDYGGVKVQLVEIPSIFRGFHKKYPNYMSIMRTADLIIVLGDKKIPLEEISQAEIKVPCVCTSVDKAKDNIWNRLNLVRVYTKQPRGGDVAKEAMGLKKGAKIRNMARAVHKDFVDKFKYARVWGKKVKFQGQKVGLGYVLEDGDTVELHIKK